MKWALLGSMLLVVVVASPALAGGYPFSGAFHMIADGKAPGPEDRAQCALAFFSQGEDGSYTGYHADLAGFIATGKLRYVQYNSGTCSYDAATRIESCTVASDTDAGEIGKTYVDVLLEVTDTKVRTMSFERLDLAQDYAANRAVPPDAATHVNFQRCAFDAAKLKAAITSDVSTLSVDDRNKLLDADKALLADPHVQAIVTAMGLGAP